MPATIALFLIAISAYPTSARGQNDPKSASACPAAADMDHQHLQGRWAAELQSAPADTPPTLDRTAVLQLGPHPELAQSVRGTVQRGGTTAQVSGDVDAGELTLEESINGTNISATWIGQVVAGSCGKEIRGTWNNATPTPSAPSAPATPPPTVTFVMRKQAGWQ
ncbi:MAG: hypothetical protein KKB95_23410 [Gammaproteobacteria bacterium]|nr:hypothetical protein [Gammaproteobacteria bacterium]MBU1354825.1 hypothetical protein [Gammaproteobacteria bacterium]MBU1506688.1 hypothetical protein [Gammaproteobacteria bacterium]MBU2121654.1 hypothetical protein [Gammaproteobacteria bacterium]MBU2173286.1 hypothetical protein [Gammaproteobacteria bacterium]